ncbi:IS630 family transposase [Rhabdochromatium marinum]|uniref:IS630 family transposase n=1 Tax=Rhabdochromatium marinum TaxID=48729 RepID=UPI001907DC76|nr:IS630 family transposase [Rhabdochromatium marinum]
MKPAWLSDARLIPDDAMDYIRKLAIRAIEENGFSPEDVIRIFGFSRSCIYDWIKRFETDGYDGLDTKKAPGNPAIVTEEMEQWLKKVILDSNPEDYGYDTMLWTCDILAEMLKKNYGITVTSTTVNQHLNRLGLTHQKPNYIPAEQDSGEFEEYLNKKYPKIQSFAKKIGADIGFQDEASVDLRDRSGKTWGEYGIRPNVYVTGKRGRLNILSVVTAKGTFYYHVTEDRINSDEFIGFLDQIIEQHDRPIFLIVDRASFHLSRKVRIFVWHHREQIRLFYLPAYSPELNPDEHVWEEIKDKQLGRKSIKNKSNLKERLHAALENLKANANRIISFFHLPKTQYAAE